MQDTLNGAFAGIMKIVRLVDPSTFFTTTAKPKYTLYYYDKFYGRAIGIILTLEAAGKVRGVDYEIKPHGEVPPGVGFAVPMVTLASGVTVSQTGAILTELGSELGLNGPQPVLCNQYIQDLTDLVGECKPALLSSPSGGARVEKWLALFEGRLASRGTKFFLGDKPTTADFHGVFAWFVIAKRYGHLDGTYPKLKKWWNDIKEEPCVRAMLDQARKDGITMMP